MKEVTSADLANNIIETVKVEKTSKFVNVINPAYILSIVCRYNNVNIDDVKGKRRFKELITARREYCYLAYKITKLSQREVGNEVGIDHATVLHHYRTISAWLGIKGYYLQEKIEQIEKMI